MVYSMIDTLKLILKHKGKIVQAPDQNAMEVVARFSDPAGNVFSLYQDQQSIKRESHQ